MCTSSHFIFSGRMFWCIFVYFCMCVKQFSIGAGQLLFSTPNIQELYLIIPPIAMALTFAPVPCLALQSLRHLMKAMLHDAIKEQGSFQKQFKQERENSACLVGRFRANCESDSQHIYNSCSYSCIAARNNCSDKMTTANNL